MIDRDELNKISMSILIHAGNARQHVLDLLTKVENNEFEAMEQYLDNANNEITIAHRAQTDILQEEASGNDIPYSTLFNHAQDTLMTAKSELLIVKRMLPIFKKIHSKLSDTQGDINV